MMGDFMGANESSRKAGQFTKIGFGAGIAIIVIYLILFFSVLSKRSTY